jgi:hypothetical protein
MLYHGKARKLGDHAAETQVVQYNHKNIKIKWMGIYYHRNKCFYIRVYIE